MADFVPEFPPETEVEEVQPATEPINLVVPEWWNLYVDGVVNNDGAGAGIELISPEEHRLQSIIQFAFKETTTAHNTRL